MDRENITIRIQELYDNSSVIYIRVVPELADFTRRNTVSLVISGQDREVSVDFDKQTHRYLLSFVKIIERIGLFSPSALKCIVGWNVKNLLSYLQCQTGYQPTITDKFIDIYNLEAFNGISEVMPKNINDAMKRASRCFKNPQWAILNKTLYHPLTTKVLPFIETNGLFDSNQRKYIHYDVGGHKNGRLRCYQPSDRFINVHTLTEELKSNIRPKEGHDFFVDFDFHHMEVSTLQWLSGDDRLLSLLTEGKDVYSEIHRIIFQTDCQDDESRDKAKRIFLPFYFGMQPFSLVGDVFANLAEAEFVFNNIENAFPVSCEWIRGKQTDEPVAKDYFGRCRSFIGEPTYKKRNFYIQSPAAVICMLKLIDVYKTLKEFLLFNVHDGYTFSCKVSDAKNLINTAKEVLQQNMEICPGLKLTVGCKVGVNLSKLKKFTVSNTD